VGLKLSGTGVLAIAGLAAAGLVGLQIYRRGLAGAASDAGSAVVNIVGGVTTGAVGTIGSAVGLPTPTQTATDAEVARWLIDNFGQFEASKWSGAPAYLRAQFMDAGSGRPPAPDSAVGREFLPRLAPQASYDETDRLARRYPGTNAPESIFSGYSDTGYSFADVVNGGGYTPWKL